MDFGHGRGKARQNQADDLELFPSEDDLGAARLEELDQLPHAAPSTSRRSLAGTGVLATAVFGAIVVALAAGSYLYETHWLRQAAGDASTTSADGRDMRSPGSPEVPADRRDTPVPEATGGDEPAPESVASTDDPSATVQSPSSAAERRAAESTADRASAPRAESPEADAEPAPRAGSTRADTEPAPRTRPDEPRATPPDEASERGSASAGSPSPAAAHADVSGSWTLATHVESSALDSFEGLRLGYELQLQQDGNRITGNGYKVTENGATVGPRARTPIRVQGTSEGDRLTLTFVEHGTQRASSGKFVLFRESDDRLLGRFASDAARSSGTVEARRH